MNARCRACRMLVLLLVAATVATAASAEIYKWVDEHGRVHYGDKPQDPAARPVHVDTAPVPDSDADVRRERQQKLLDALTDERDTHRQEAAAAVEERKRRQANCGIARQNLSKMTSASFLYKPGSDPSNPEILTDAERDKATMAAQAEVKKWCEG